MSLSKSIAKSVTIDVSADANNSSGISTDGMLLSGIIFPAAMTGTALTVDFSLDGSTWYDVVKQTVLKYLIQLLQVTQLELTLVVGL